MRNQLLIFVTVLMISLSIVPIPHAAAPFSYLFFFLMHDLIVEHEIRADPGIILLCFVGAIVYSSALTVFLSGFNRKMARVVILPAVLIFSLASLAYWLIHAFLLIPYLIFPRLWSVAMVAVFLAYSFLVLAGPVILLKNFRKNYRHSTPG